MLAGLIIKITKVDEVYSYPYKQFINDDEMSQNQYTLGIRLDSIDLPDFSRLKIHMSNLDLDSIENDGGIRKHFFKYSQYPSDFDLEFMYQIHQ